MTTVATLAAYIALALTAGLIGWLYGRGGWGKRAASPRTPEPRTDLPAGYYAGLDSLINEQPDRAVEIFTRLLEVDQDTIETHFALGSLYRRRGEVDRAIHIHQNILARANLAAEHHQQALWALAQDYLRAGVLDRSEKLLQQLSGMPNHRTAALLALLSICELQNDWTQAVAVHHDLPAAIATERAGALAHYHCELAAAAHRQNRQVDARRYLRLARGLKRRCARANLMRAQVAANRGAHDLAVRLLLRVLDEEWHLLLEVLPRFIDSARRSGHERHIASLLARVGRLRGERCSDLAQALLMIDDVPAGALEDVVQGYINGTADLAEIARISDRPHDQRRAVRAFLRLAARGERYQCGTCGFASQALFWQCPGCKTWDSMSPVWMIGRANLMNHRASATAVDRTRR